MALVETLSLLSFKVPTQVDEAAERVLFLLGCETSDFLSHDMNTAVAMAHMTLGREIRNHWFRDLNTPLYRQMTSKGLWHRDDMSGIVLGAAWYKGHGKEWTWENCGIEEFKAHWEEAEAGL
jgi:hypothetical protein